MKMKSREKTLELLQKLINQKFLEKEERYPVKERRYTELLRNPEHTSIDDGGWFICVPLCFNDCLDISKTERVLKDQITGEKKQKKIWTQGSRFAFHRGCILYDTHKAYQSWSLGINAIKYCISVHSGKNAKPGINKDKREPGEVEFSVFSPNPKTKNMKAVGEFKLTQDEFVRFLINGNPNIVSKWEIENNKF